MTETIPVNTLDDSIAFLADRGFDILEEDQTEELKPERGFFVQSIQRKIHRYLTPTELMRFAQGEKSRTVARERLDAHKGGA